MSLAAILTNISRTANFVQQSRKQNVAVLARDVRRILADILKQSRNSCDLTHKQGVAVENVCRVYAISPPPIKAQSGGISDNAFCFYQNSFAIELLDKTVSAKFISNELTAIAIYNLALGYHLEAMRRGKSKLLQKALSMYETVVSSLNGCSGSVVRSLLLAVNNNRGHAHVYNFQMEQAVECRRALMELIRGYCQLSGVIVEDELLSVVLKSLVYSSNRPCAAPAA